MEWRKCSGFDGYEVSEHGDVRRSLPARGGKVGAILRPHVRADGYRMYILRKNGRSIHRKAHQLVCETFHGPRPSERHEVCHNDGTRTNDHYLNLRWGSRASNQADRNEHGTDHRGERHPGCKLTQVQIEEIRLCAGECQRSIADRYGISQSQVWRIVNRARWKHV